jgi:hypothetical protein
MGFRFSILLGLSSLVAEMGIIQGLIKPRVDGEEVSNLQFEFSAVLKTPAHQHHFANPLLG